MQKKWVFFIPVIIAIAVFVALKQNKKAPQRNQAQERVTHVRYIKVPSVSVTPSTSGYGTVKPATNWAAIAEVKGKITYKNPKLKKGAILEANSLLISIDPTDYQLSIAQTQADIAATRAQQDELLTKQKNTRASLAIEQRSLELTKTELQRQKKLVKQGSVSFSDVEKQERTLLGQQQSVQNQRNTLNLIPSQQALLDAQLLRQQAQLKSLQRDLANTEIKLPFAGRVADVNIEQDQYVREGEILSSIDSLDKAEIEVQIPLNSLRSIIHSKQVVNAEKIAPEQLRKSLSLKAEVFLNEGDVSISWPAHFARLSDTLDPKTRTVGVIVEVDRPYAQVQPGLRPPLVKGLFVKVKLTGAAHPSSILVPNSAIRSSSDSNQKQVYLINSEDRLEIRPIKIKITQDEYVTVKSGLNAGEKLVISDLLPAIKNMLLSGQEDKLLFKRLLQQAAGSGQVDEKKP